MMNVLKILSSDIFSLKFHDINTVLYYIQCYIIEMDNCGQVSQILRTLKWHNNF